MADGQQLLDVLREDDTLLIDGEQQLLEVVEAVKRTGKAGRITITLDVKRPKKAADAIAIWVTGNVSSKIPRPDTEDHLFFAQDGELTRRDPRQPRMPGFQRVNRDTGEIVEDEQEDAANG